VSTARELSIAILAGGAATRLDGRDKGLQVLDGEPLVARLLRALDAKMPVLIVANRNLDRYAAYAPTITDQDAVPRGPLAGIAAALAHDTAPWMLTVPVDCPDPPADLAVRLLAATRVHRERAFVAHDGERRQPLFALYRRDLARSAAHAAAMAQGVWQWQDTVGVRELDFADRRAHFLNLNTSADFAAYAERSGE